MKWDKIFPLLSAMIGGLLGAVLSVMAVPWSESLKLEEIKRAEALAEFATKSWGPDTEETRAQLARQISLLSVYGSPAVLKAYADYRRRGCGGSDRTNECRQAWVKVVQTIRDDVRRPQAKASDIMDTLYGPQPSGPPTK